MYLTTYLLHFARITTSLLQFAMQYKLQVHVSVDSTRAIAILFLCAISVERRVIFQFFQFKQLIECILLFVISYQQSIDSNALQ